MGMFRPKLVRLEARQLCDAPNGNGIDIAAWCGGQWLPPIGAVEQAVIVPPAMDGESEKRCNSGDWVVEHPPGIFRVWTAEEFEQNYEPAP